MKNKYESHIEAIMTNRIKCLENHTQQAGSADVKCCNVCVLLCKVL
jgi:hypothetical protein